MTRRPPEESPHNDISLPDALHISHSFFVEKPIDKQPEDKTHHEGDGGGGKEGSKRYILDLSNVHA